MSDVSTSLFKHATFDARIHFVVGAYTLLHLIIAAILPLAPHEIHYSSYAQHLDWSYLDHPPLVAWLQAAAISLSTSAFAARLVPITLAALTMYLLAALAQRISSERVASARPADVALLAVLILQGTLVFHGAMTLSPDAALLPAALAVALLTWRALEQDHYRDWLLLGLALGVAGLAKYTAVTLAVSVTAIALIARGPRVLISSRLWLAGATCLLVISPVLIWNWQQDWITVSFHNDYQFDDVDRWSAAALAESTGIQLGLYSPLLVVGGLLALVGVLKNRAGSPTVTWPHWLLPAFALPPLLTFLLAVLESRASPHWSILGWLFLAPLTAAWVLAGWQRRGVRVLSYISATYSVVVLVALLIILVPIGRWPDYRHPIKLVMGWPQTTERAVQLLAQLDADGRREPELLARNWHHIPILQWYAPGVAVKSLFADLNPYNLRNGVADHETWGILIYPGERDEPRGIEWITRDFDCTPIDRLVIERAGSKLQTVHFYECQSLLPETPVSETKTPG